VWHVVHAHDRDVCDTLTTYIYIGKSIPLREKEGTQVQTEYMFHVYISALRIHTYVKHAHDCDVCKASQAYFDTDTSILPYTHTRA